MINTDILIIGAGPTGLFTVFEAGLLNLRCHLIDSLPMPGGQCAEIYPKKPIYDIPSHPEIIAGDLVKKLMDQISPFKPGFTLTIRSLSIDTKEISPPSEAKKGLISSSAFNTFSFISFEFIILFYSITSNHISDFYSLSWR